jgi:hypothetical protein
VLFGSRPDYTVIFTVFFVFTASSPQAPQRPHGHTPGHASAPTPWRIALRTLTLARTPDGDAESLSNDYIDAMHIAPNATEPR